MFAVEWAHILSVTTVLLLLCVWFSIQLKSCTNDHCVTQLHATESYTRRWNLGQLTNRFRSRVHKRQLQNSVISHKNPVDINTISSQGVLQKGDAQVLLSVCLSGWSHNLTWGELDGFRRAAARLLGSRLRKPTRARIFVSCVCVVRCCPHQADHLFRGVLLVIYIYIYIYI